MTDELRLYHCSRMNASITTKQCGINKNGGYRIPAKWACEGCPGLGEENMSIRGHCPKCGRDDVILTSKNGDCHRCYTREKKGQGPLGDVPKNGIVPKSTRPKPGQSPPVSEHEKHVAALIEVFKQKQAAELTQFCAGLDRLTDSYERLKFAFHACFGQ